MKMIFAQGNPGTQYRQSRHNVGFYLLDEFASQHSASFTSKPKFHADIAELIIGGEKTLLVKPSTFYNETGQAARALVDFYKLSPNDDMLVIHDELALPFGTVRIRQKGSDGGNNGIKSLNAHLGPDFTRLRIGVYNELRDRMPDADFVLGNFSQHEAKVLHATIAPKINELIDAFCADTLEVTSHTLYQLDTE
jgi:PTH1 family peptidyl-tRNA hydrolase